MNITLEIFSLICILLIRAFMLINMEFPLRLYDFCLFSFTNVRFNVKLANESYHFI